MERFDKDAYFLKEEARGCKVVHNADGSTTVIPPKQHGLLKLRNNVIMILVVFGMISIGGVILYAVSLVFNPLLLLLILPAWILYFVFRHKIKRRYSLKHYGYFGGGFEQGACKYEEYIMGKLMELKIKLENTEPGHWELFVPTESEWRSIVPDWAVNRRREIIERVIPYLKSSDIHFPDDYKK